MTTDPDPIPPPVRAEVERRLSGIEADAVRILCAVESGSRAWGFPSPDSDYDIRFLYVRPRAWYLGLVPGRDVIEQPIVDEIDLGGWDIRKALMLMLKSNAVVSEWLASPIRYRRDDPVVVRLAALADAAFDPRALAHHYASLGRNAMARWAQVDGAVPVKRYFYALRPALTIRCLRQDPARRPPMNLQALMAASDLAPTTVAAIEALVDAKSRTNERDNTLRLPALDALIADELARAGDLPAAERTDDHVAAADALFLDLVGR